MTEITHRARIEKTLAGEKPDRVPVSLWRHFPVDDQHPARLAEATLAFQAEYDFDFVKVTPESTYFAKEWGCDDEWRGNPEGTREYLYRQIQHPEDWEDLAVLDPRKGRLGDQLACLHQVADGLGPDTPFLETIFSPLGQARKLAGEDLLLAHMRQYPEAVHAGLKVITESTLRFIEEAKKTGIAGIFYALQFAQYRRISLEEYDAFGRPYHEQVLHGAGDLWFNLIHVHGSHLMFEQAAALPAQAINWHDRETSPSLAEGQEQFKGVVCGGLRQWDTMLLGTPEQVQREAQDAVAVTGGLRFILGTGCVTPITAPHGNLNAARRAVDEL